MNFELIFQILMLIVGIVLLTFVIIPGLISPKR